MIWDDLQTVNLFHIWCEFKIEEKKEIRISRRIVLFPVFGGIPHSSAIINWWEIVISLAVKVEHI